ncbi:MAG: DHH family phosphoesterase [Candidatus Micrarchaeota archaeon]|nr:DHH family phosphoesterase [Candidatus Micrarchaeota archaeon]
MMKISFNELLNFLILNKEKRFLITFHSIGDRDSIGSAIALHSYLTNSIIAMPDLITNSSRRVLESLSAPPKIGNKIPSDIFGTIVVDANSLEATGQLEKQIKKTKKSILFIDHHEPNKSDELKAMVFADQAYNSTSSLIHHILTSLGVKVETDASVALLNGIVADSANFHNMHALTFKQVSELLHSAGMTYSEFLERFGPRVPPQSRLDSLKEVCSASRIIAGNNLILYGPATTHASIAAETAIDAGADAAVFWLIGKKEVSISARLRPPLEREFSIHLGKIMQEIGPMVGGSGGGHPAAAGAYGPKVNMAGKATDKILFELKKKLSQV